MHKHFNNSTYIPCSSNLPNPTFWLPWWNFPCRPCCLVVYNMEDWGLQFHSLVPLVLPDNWRTHWVFEAKTTRHFEGSTLIAVNAVIISLLPWQIFLFRNGGMGLHAKVRNIQHENGTFKSQTSQQCRLNETFAERLFAKSAWRTCKSPRQDSACRTTLSWHLFDPIIFSSICIWTNVSFACSVLLIPCLYFPICTWSYCISWDWFLKCTIRLPIVLHEVRTTCPL